MQINQNSQPEIFRRSNKIRKIIKDGIVLNFSKTNDLIQKYGDNSKQIKRINYTKNITKGNNYFYLRYLELSNIDVLCNFCSNKDLSVLKDLKKNINNDNELIKHFDKNFAKFLLDNEFPFSKKFKEMHNYNYINDNKYSTICLDEINPQKKSKKKANEIKIFSKLKDNLTDNNKNNNNKNYIFNNNNNNDFYSESAKECFYIEPKKKRFLNNKSFANNNLINVETGDSTNNKNDNNDNINNFNYYKELQINNLNLEEMSEKNESISNNYFIDFEMDDSINNKNDNNDNINNFNYYEEEELSGKNHSFIFQ